MLFRSDGLFQSTPVIIDGRCNPRCAVISLPVCFNPRPSSLTGDARCTCQVLHCWPCFNPRPSSLTGDALRYQGVANKSFFNAFARAITKLGSGCTGLHIKKEKGFQNQWSTLRANPIRLPPSLPVRGVDYITDAPVQSTSGPSKSTALKLPCSRTSKPRVSGSL